MKTEHFLFPLSVYSERWMESDSPVLALERASDWNFRIADIDIAVANKVLHFVNVSDS